MGVQISSEISSFPSVHSLSLLGNRTGFLVSSFDVSSENRIYFIQSDFFAEEDALPSQLVDAVAALPTRECSYGLSDAGQIQQRQSYLSAVAQLIREIRKGSVSKVVYSRTVSKKAIFPMADYLFYIPICRKTIRKLVCSGSVSRMWACGWERLLNFF